MHNNKWVSRVFFGMLVLLLSSQLAIAADLIDVYQDALENDPTIKAARSTLFAQQEALPQARADLLPFLRASGDVRTNRLYSKNTGVDSQDTFSGTRHYGSQNYFLNLSQPIFNYERWKRLKEASATVKQAAANYSSAVQDLMIRVAGAYFAVLEAQDTLAFTTAEKRANAKELEQVSQRHKVGIEPITSVNDAQARYDAVVASEIAAKNRVDNSRELLWEITGKYYPSLAKLKSSLPLLAPKPNRMEAWVTAAKDQNYTVQAARYELVAAKERIGISQAGHYPTLDLIAEHEDGEDASAFSSGKFKTRQSGLGVKFTVPLFEGGKVNSRTRAANYDYQTSQFSLQRVYRNTISITRQTYNNVMSGISQVKADRQAVISAESSVSSSDAAFKVGTRTIVDLLDAQRDLYNAQRQLAADQYAYINNLLALKQAAAILTARDLAEVNSWLISEHSDSSPSKPKTKNNKKDNK